MPRSLFAAAWLLFCIYVADLDREWRLCEVCGRVFSFARSYRRICSKVCQRARHRSEEALVQTPTFRPSRRVVGSTLLMTTLPSVVRAPRELALLPEPFLLSDAPGTHNCMIIIYILW
jgi:hypothetical protein